MEEEEHQLTLPAATVGENQTTDAGAELQTLSGSFSFVSVSTGRSLRAGENLAVGASW